MPQLELDEIEARLVQAERLIELGSYHLAAACLSDTALQLQSVAQKLERQYALRTVEAKL